ncbi:hypothetical protein G3T14_00740 [Methylobacterium sp. BTF04]|nr:hypothetical protein [Methylobacterium sp. BTF04]
MAAADFVEGSRGYGRADSSNLSDGPSLPRYFPREGDDTAPPRPAQPVRRVVGCVPRRVPIPTDAPGDPSYVGSAYGLGKPSYYGFTPPLGVDDPYGRPLLPYCP